MKFRLPDWIHLPWRSLRKVKPYYPSSFLKLIVIGFLLVAAPLAIGLINSAISIDRLAKQSQRAVYQAAEAAKDSRVLLEEVTAMERRLRQAVILNDLSLLEGYRLSHTRFLKSARRLADLPLDDEYDKLVNKLMRAEMSAYEKAVNAPTAAAAEIAVKDYIELENIARQISAVANALIEREIEAMRELSDRTLRFTQWQLLALIPVALFLVFGFILLIARPINQIETAIRRIGRGDLAGEISVDGPQDLHYLGERLDWMRLRLQDLEEQKSRFLRQLSHELKTPLSALREGTELLSDEVVGPITSDQRQVVNILKHSGIKLQRLIEDLLSYSSLRQNPLKLNTCLVAIRPIIEHVLLDQMLAIQNKKLITTISGEDISIIADEEKMRIIVDNLMSNAIKFSPLNGRIEMTISHEDSVAVLEVFDEGPGIAVEEREKIFEPFYQGKALSDGYIKGTGLGLSIARELVQAHGGNIMALEKGSGGARIRITLPDIGPGAAG